MELDRYAAPGSPVPKPPMRERDLTELRREERHLSLAGAGEPEAIASVAEIGAREHEPARPVYLELHQRLPSGVAGLFLEMPV